VRERQRELKRLVNLPEMRMGEETIVVTSTEPTPLRFRFDRDRLLDIAMAQRMELLEEELNIAQQNATIAMARNDLLPLVILDYTYGASGSDSRGFGEAYGDLADREDERHSVGLTVEVPIGNAGARSRLRQSLARRLQQLATKESRIQTITKEVLDAADDMESNWQQILSTRTQVRTANRALNVEINRFKVGENTSRDVLEAQTRLARAAQAEVDAIAAYQINQVDLAFATGTTLGASGVTWAPAAGGGERVEDRR
jgi:outer membrane protein